MGGECFHFENLGGHGKKQDLPGSGRAFEEANASQHPQMSEMLGLSLLSSILEYTQQVPRAQAYPQASAIPGPKVKVEAWSEFVTGSEGGGLEGLDTL
jgi:hypothetical protein